MQKNIGTVDMLIRLVIGVVLGYIGFLKTRLSQPVPLRP